MKLKYMQNSSKDEVLFKKNVKIETTMSRLDIYELNVRKGKHLIGSAGVKNPKDFDYNALLFFAKQQIGTTIFKAVKGDC